METVKSFQNTVLILYTEIFSSEENLNYWKSKVENQLKEGSPFGLIAVIPTSSLLKKSSKSLIDDYKKWMQEVKPLFQSHCYGHAIVGQDETILRKCTGHYLKKIEDTVGCECRVFLELDEAIQWLNSPM